MNRKKIVIYEQKKKTKFIIFQITPSATFFSVLHLQNLRGGEHIKRGEHPEELHRHRVTEKSELQNVQHKLQEDQDEEVNLIKTQQEQQQLQKQQK